MVKREGERERGQPCVVSPSEGARIKRSPVKSVIAPALQNTGS